MKCFRCGKEMGVDEMPFTDGQLCRSCILDHVNTPPLKAASVAPDGYVGDDSVKPPGDEFLFCADCKDWVRFIVKDHALVCLVCGYKIAYEEGVPCFERADWYEKITCKSCGANLGMRDHLVTTPQGFKCGVCGEVSSEVDVFRDYASNDPAFHGWSQRFGRNVSHAVD